MTVSELTRDQLIQLKQDYMEQLADCGEFAEVMGVDYDEPSYGDLEGADELIPDSLILERYSGTVFVEDDFWP